MHGSNMVSGISTTSSCFFKKIQTCTVHVRKSLNTVQAMYFFFFNVYTDIYSILTYSNGFSVLSLSKLYLKFYSFTSHT